MPHPAFGPERRPASLGLFLFFCAGFADGVLLPFFPIWARGVAHVPDWGVGLLFACYAGGEIAAAPFIGGIADRVGRRPVLILSSLGIGLGFLSLFFIKDIVFAALALVLTGVCESVLHPTIMTVIGDVTEDGEQGRWYARTHVANNAGQIAGPIAGAVLALVSLPTVFLGSGWMLLLGSFAMAALLAETRGIARMSDDDEEEEGLSGLLPAFRDRRLAGLLIWFALFEVSGNWIESVIPLYAHDTGLLSPSGVGTLFAYAACLNVALQMRVHRIGEAWSAMRLALSAGVALALGFALLVVSPSFVALVAAVTLCALGQMLTGPMIPVAINALAPASRRATYMAAASVGTDLKDSLGPALGTALYAVAPRLTWFVGMPLAVGAAIGLGTALAGQRASVIGEAP